MVALVTVVLAGGCGGTVAEPVVTDAPAPTPSPTPPPIPSPASPSPTPSPTRTVPAGPTSDPATWPLAWSDEFDGAAGSPPDAASWTYDIGGGGWGNNELQFYTDDPRNAALDGKGHLRLTVRESDGSLACHYGPCEYTSARLLTRGRHEPLYGRIEARIKVPAGFGLWPAFWMLGSDIDTVSWPASGEIDVMEFVGRRPNEILGTIHGPGYSGSSGITGFVDLDDPVSDSFHVFTMDWLPDRITWYLDGVQYHEATPADVAPNPWVFDHPFFLLLNVAVGGNLGGPVFPDTTFPASMAVDYVRIYQEATP
jgi:beta-glucanase (GH16 family)